MLRIIGKKEQSSPSALIWQVECPRDDILADLKFAGKDEVGVSVPRQEEDRLQLVAVFTDAPSATSLRMILDGTSHCGVHGPTRNGQYVIKTTRKDLGIIRQRVLGPRSHYAGQWDLVPDHKFEGLFPAAMSMQSVAKTLASVWRWRCVALQARRQGRNHHVIVLGAEKDPPAWEVSVLGEITVLRRVGKAEAELACEFTPPVPRAEEDKDVVMATAAPSIPEAVVEKCNLTLKAMKQQVSEKEARLEKSLDAALEKRCSEKETGLQAQIQKLENDQAKHRKEVQGLLENLDKKVDQNQKQAQEALSAAVTTLTQSTNDRLDKVTKSIEEQAGMIQRSQSDVQAQLKTFGQEIMTQLAKLDSEKRRKGEDHRGGMQPRTPSSRSVSPARSSSSSDSSSSSSVLVVTSVVDSGPRNAGMEGTGDGGSAGGILSDDWQAGILEKLRQVVGSAAQASSRSGDSGPAKSKSEEREVLAPVHSGSSGSHRRSGCAFSQTPRPRCSDCC